MAVYNTPDIIDDDKINLVQSINRSIYFLPGSTKDTRSQLFEDLPTFDLPLGLLIKEWNCWKDILGGRRVSRTSSERSLPPQLHYMYVELLTGVKIKIPVEGRMEWRRNKP